MLGTRIVMKKMLIALCAVVLAGIAGQPAAAEGEFDFSTIRWGMSKREFLKKEKREAYFTNRTALYYTGTLGGRDVSVIYDFTDRGRLYGVFYTTPPERQKSDADMKMFYDKIVAILVKQYREPQKRATPNTIDAQRWDNDTMTIGISLYSVESNRPFWLSFISKVMREEIMGDIKREKEQERQKARKQ